MGQKRLRNLDKRLARQVEEDRRKFEQAIKFKVNTAGSTMDHIHAYMHKCDTQAFRVNRKDIFKDNNIKI